MKESLSFFSFERDLWPWTLAVEEMEFAWQSIGYCFTDLVTDSLDCVLLIPYEWIKESS